MVTMTDINLEPNCALCGGKNYSLVLATSLNSLPSVFKQQNTKQILLMKCTKCGLISLGSTITEALVDSYYSRKYYSSMGRGVDNFYRLLIAREFLLSKGSAGKILEVGCGDGSLLVIMKAHGWDASGTDISSVAVKLSQKKIGKNKVIKGYLKNANFDSVSFDAICLRHVLEHLENPLEDLQEINRILKNNGILCLIVPNIESISFRMFGENWFHLDIPRHCYHYSFNTLRLLASKAGFELIKVSASPEDPLDWLRSLCYSLHITPSFPSYLLPFIAILAALTSPISYLLSKINRSSAIQCYFTKRQSSFCSHQQGWEKQ
jgi:SAM-dependent methyltransferase